MISLSDSTILNQNRDLSDFMKSSKSPLFLFDKLMETVLSRNFQESIEKSGEEYEIIRIAPPIPDMIRGNMNPIVEFKFPRKFQPEGFSHPIWYGKAINGIRLTGMGYINGDKRFLVKSVLNCSLEGTHFVLGGATGHGKSVTLHSILVILMLEYPPWELQLTLSDSKLTEFPKYLVGNSAPLHVRNVIATEDSNYVLSVLDYMESEMKAMNSALGQYNNMNSFRKGTGLTVPTNLIVLEEFTALLKGDPTREGKIIEKVASFARLGRNTDYHIGLSSQEMNSVKADTFSNVPIRLCLGSTEEISEKILGNKGASNNYKEVGKLIVNENAINKSVNDNVEVRVPFIDDLTLVNYVKKLEILNDMFPYTRNLSKYTEQDIINENIFTNRLKSCKIMPDRFYLGVPSFIFSKADDASYFYIDLKARDEENIAILSPGALLSREYIKTLLINIELFKDKKRSLVWIANPDNGLDEEFDFQRFATVYHKVRFSTDEGVLGLARIMMYRHILLEGDSLVFDKGYSTIHEDYKEAWELRMKNPEDYRYCDKTPEADIQFRRASAWVKVLNELPVKGIVDVPTTKEGIIELLDDIMYSLHVTGHRDGRRITKDSFSKIYGFFLMLNKIFGFGTAPTIAQKNILVFMLRDCHLYNVHMTVTATDITELASELKPYVRYAIFDRRVAETMPSRLGHKSFNSSDVPDNLYMISDKQESSDTPLRIKRIEYKESQV